MYCFTSFKQNKRTFRTASMQACLFSVLMICSMVLQAASPENAVANEGIAEGNADASSGTQAQQQVYKFPRWPQRQQKTRQRIPPPPPGPYMSTALSDHSVTGPSFGRDVNRSEANNPAFNFDPSGMPMSAFSPDRPWPDNLRSNETSSPNRWMPEKGYQYVKPAVKQRHRAAKNAYYRRYHPGSMPGRSSGPNMSGSDPRWAPAMGMSRPSGPAYRRPEFYAPNGSSRYNGAVNNSGMNPVNPANQAPYSPGQP